MLLNSRKIRWFYSKFHWKQNTQRNSHLFKMCENGHCNCKMNENQMRLECIDKDCNEFLLFWNCIFVNCIMDDSSKVIEQEMKRRKEWWKAKENENKYWEKCLLNQVECKPPYITQTEKQKSWQLFLKAFRILFHSNTSSTSCTIRWCFVARQGFNHERYSDCDND